MTKKELEKEIKRLNAIIEWVRNNSGPRYHIIDGAVIQLRKIHKHVTEATNG